jgi:hypothetical protein
MWHVGDRKNEYRVLVREIEREHLKDIGINVKILKWMSKKQDEMA